MFICSLANVLLFLENTMDIVKIIIKNRLSTIYLHYKIKIESIDILYVIYFYLICNISINE